MTRNLITIRPLSPNEIPAEEGPLQRSNLYIKQQFPDGISRGKKCLRNCLPLDCPTNPASLQRLPSTGCALPVPFARIHTCECETPPKPNIEMVDFKSW